MNERAMNERILNERLMNERPVTGGAMTGRANRCLVVAAGGTGGHVFPAEALTAELARRGHRVVIVTDRRSGALHAPGFRNRECHVLPGAGLAGRGMMRALGGAMSLALGTLQARFLLKRLDPAAVIGFGGYPTVAPVLATRLLRRRPAVVLHEQNAVLGRANRMLARAADVLALGFADTTRLPPGATGVVTGNPVRPAVRDSAQAYVPPAHDGPLHLLVTGGSLGARVFSDVVPAAIAALPPDLRSRLRVVQQARAEDLDRVRAAYQQVGVAAELSPFFTDMPARLAAAHLVIARAGASTVAELTVAARPAILVPLPHAIDDHQSSNARALATAGGAWVMAQPRFTPDALQQELRALLTTPAQLSRAAAAAAMLARRDAAAVLADLVESLLGQQALTPHLQETCA